jgi:acetolactate synthase-1/2/3 large subunit
VHLVWRDGAYDMVRIQQMMKYGRESGVSFGMPDIVRFAASFGAKGFRIDRPEAILPTLKKAMNLNGPVLIDVPIDYSDNRSLCRTMEEESGH